VAFAAGLAHAGLKPVVCLYSTFLQRAYDQIVHDVALPGLGVTFAVDRAGLVGADGATHQGAFDIGLLRALPGLHLAAAVAGADLDVLLERAVLRHGPSVIRFPRGTVPRAPPGLGPPIGARWLRPPGPVNFVTFGPLGLTALEAAQELGAGVLDAVELPLDEAAVLEAARAPLVTVEEGTERGGFGAAVLELLARSGVLQRVKVLGLPGGAFVRHGEARTQRAALGLDPAGLARAAAEVLAR
jgi:1-deoxy-D-xylulose-5-phosphate synthase